MTPYYQDDYVTIYHGDCREIVPTLGRFCLLLTDPPYGIKQANGMGGGGRDGFGGKSKRAPRKYAGNWDSAPPSAETIKTAIASATVCIMWGGNYFASVLPQQSKWLVWNKLQTMPTYSDAELAWTNLPGFSVKMYAICGAGIMAKERARFHPTQKPVELMSWCIQLAGDDIHTILDPFAGSGTTGRAAKDLGRKCTLIEREEKYCEIAAKRMRQEVLPLW